LINKAVSDGLNYLILAVNTKEYVLHLIYFGEGWGLCECNWPGGSGKSNGDTLLCFGTEKEKLLGCRKKIQLNRRPYRFLCFTCHTL